MSVQRKRYSADEKTKVAIEALKGQKTLNELATEYGVHPSQITQWKKQAVEEIGTGFSGGRARRERTDEALVASLYQEIGQLKMEMDWLKKSVGRVEEMRALIERVISPLAWHDSASWWALPTLAIITNHCQNVRRSCC